MIKIAEKTGKSPFPSDKLTETERSAKVPKISVDDAVISINANASADVCVFLIVGYIYLFKHILSDLCVVSKEHELDQIFFLLNTIFIKKLECIFAGLPSNRSGVEQVSAKHVPERTIRHLRGVLQVQARRNTVEPRSTIVVRQTPYQQDEFY